MESTIWSAWKKGMGPGPDAWCAPRPFCCRGRPPTKFSKKGGGRV